MLNNTTKNDIKDMVNRMINCASNIERYDIEQNLTNIVTEEVDGSTNNILSTLSDSLSIKDMKNKLQNTIDDILMEINDFLIGHEMCFHSSIRVIDNGVDEPRYKIFLELNHSIPVSQISKLEVNDIWD